MVDFCILRQLTLFLIRLTRFLKKLTLYGFC